LVLPFQLNSNAWISRQCFTPDRGVIIPQEVEHVKGLEESGLSETQDIVGPTEVTGRRVSVFTGMSREWAGELYTLPPISVYPDPLQQDGDIPCLVDKMLLPSIKQNYALLFYRDSIDSFRESIDLLLFRQEHLSGRPLMTTLQATVGHPSFN